MDAKLLEAIQLRQQLRRINEEAQGYYELYQLTKNAKMYERAKQTIEQVTPEMFEAIKDLSNYDCDGGA